MVQIKRYIKGKNMTKKAGYSQSKAIETTSTKKKS
jgi:phage terminase small subunit